MMRRIREAARGLRDDRGLSVSELLIALVLAGLVIAMVGGFFVSVNRAIGLSQASDTGTRAAANIANEVSRVVRNATMLPVSGSSVPASALVYADEKSIVLYSYVDANAVSPAPTMVQFTFSTTGVIEKRWNPTASGNYWVFGSYATATPASTRNLGSGVTLPTVAAPAFYYFQGSGAALTLPGSGGLTAANCALVASIKLSVVVPSSARGTSDSTTLTNTITMPNLGLTGVSS